MPEGISEKETAQRLMAYHRSIVRVLPSYPKTLKVISADQPCVDVFYQGERGALCPFPRCHLLQLGTPGSGHRQPGFPRGSWERPAHRPWADVPHAVWLADLTVRGAGIGASKDSMGGARRREVLPRGREENVY